MNKNELATMFKACFVIAVIIFVVAVTSEFSVRMFYSSTDPIVQIISGLIAVLFITCLIALLLYVTPSLRKALLRTFGMETPQ